MGERFLRCMGDYGLQTFFLQLFSKSVDGYRLYPRGRTGIHAFNERESLADIRAGTCRDNDSDRHIMRIHGQMPFCVSPLLCGSCPDCRGEFLWHEGALHQSYPIQKLIGRAWA